MSRDSGFTVSEIRNKSSFMKFQQEMALQKTEKDKGELRTKFGFKEDHNSILNLSIDPYR